MSTLGLANQVGFLTERVGLGWAYPDWCWSPSWAGSGSIEDEADSLARLLARLEGSYTQSSE
jgi:hypothetical protein